MGVRPPTGDAPEPDAVTFGIAALDGRLTDAGVAFPATADELRTALGDVSIPYDPSGNEMALGTALDRVDREHFETRQDLLNDLHPVFEEQRASTSSTVLGQLRSLLPF